MAQRIKRKSKRDEHMSYTRLMELTGGRNPADLNEEELTKLGFGDFIKKHGVAVGKGLLGAGLMAIPGLQVPALGFLGDALGDVGNTLAQDSQIKAQDAQTAQLAQQQEIAAKNNAIFNNPNALPTYGPAAKYGGRLKKYQGGGGLEGPNLTPEGNVVRTNELEILHDKLRNHQGVLTDALQKKVGDKINIKDVLTSYSSSPDYNRKGLNKYTDAFISKYGDVHLTPEEVKSTLGENYDDYVQSKKAYLESDYYKAVPVGLQGTKEAAQYDPASTNWGARHMMEIYRNPGPSEIYKHLSPPKQDLQYGGTINYEGQSHEGPDGGIPVDGMGNPTGIKPDNNPKMAGGGNMNKNAALVQGGETASVMPDGSAYVLSDDLYFSEGVSFADADRNLLKRLGKNRVKWVAGKAVIKDDTSKKWYEQENKKLISQQEQLKAMTMPQQPQQGLPMAERGGGLPKYSGVDPTTGNSNFIWKWDAKKDYQNNTALFDTTMKDQYGVNPHNKSFSGIDTTGGLPNAADFRKQSMQKDILPSYKDAVTTPKSTSTSTTPWSGMTWGETGAAALPGIASGVANLLRPSMKNKFQRLSLPQIQAEQINLENERAAAREQANVARANVSRGIRGGAPTAGGYMANMIAGETGIQRGLGQQLGQSYQNEAVTNTQMRQQASMVNQEAKMREAMYNAQLGAQEVGMDQARKNQAASMIGQGITGAVNQKFQSSRDADYVNMLNPNYHYTMDYGKEDPNWWNRQFNYKRKLTSRV